MASGKSPIKRIHQAVVPARAQAVDASVPIFRAPFDGTVTAVSYAAEAAITGAATNTRRVALVNKGLNGAGTTIVAELQFNNGVNATAADEKVIPVSGTAANLAVTAGQLLAWESEAVGTGIADPGGLAILEFERT